MGVMEAVVADPSASFVANRADAGARSGDCDLREFTEKVLEILGEIVGRRVAFPCTFRQSLEANPLQLLGNGVVPLTRGARFLKNDLLQHFVLGLTSKRRATDEQFVEDESQAENVAAPVDPVTFAPGLLGAHVGGGSREPRPFADVFFSQCQSEVHHMRLAVIVDEDIGRLYVSVDQSSLVGIVQRLGHGRHKFRRLLPRKPRLLKRPCQIGSLDIPRDDEERKVRRASDVVDRDDMRVFEAGHSAGFGQIEFGIFGARNPIRVGHFDGDGAIQLFVPCPKNEAEAPSSQQPFNPIAANSFR